MTSRKGSGASTQRRGAVRKEKAAGHPRGTDTGGGDHQRTPAPGNRERSKADAPQHEGAAGLGETNPPGTELQPLCPEGEDRQFLSPQKVKDFTAAVRMKAQDCEGKDSELLK